LAIGTQEVQAGMMPTHLDSHQAPFPCQLQGIFVGVHVDMDRDRFIEGEG
jgi:hypothetical protein